MKYNDIQCYVIPMLYLEQDTLPLLLGFGWFQARIQT